MKDNRKQADYGPSSYNLDIDFDLDFDFTFDFTFWNYCQLLLYSLFLLPLFLVWQLALLPLVEGIRKIVLNKKGKEFQAHHFPVGSTCPWPREASL